MRRSIEPFRSWPGVPRCLDLVGFEWIGVVGRVSGIGWDGRIVWIARFVVFNGMAGQNVWWCCQGGKIAHQFKPYQLDPSGFSISKPTQDAKKCEQRKRPTFKQKSRPRDSSDS